MMYYAKKFATKWHDTDACGILRPSRILEYMQETANLQCRDFNMDLNTLFYERGLGFLLSRSQVSIYAPLYAYEDIEVRTWCPPSRALSFLRNFQVLRGDTVVAEALTTWALLDIHKKSLVRVNDFDGEFPLGDPLDETKLPAKVRIGSGVEMDCIGQRRIVYSDLDFNHHMNNTKYADMLCDFIPDIENKYVASLSLSYLKEATAGDVLSIHLQARSDLENAYLCKAIRSDGQICCEASLILRQNS